MVAVDFVLAITTWSACTVTRGKGAMKARWNFATGRAKVSINQRKSQDSERRFEESAAN